MYCSVTQRTSVGRQNLFACVFSHVLFSTCSLSQVALPKFLGPEFGLFPFQLVMGRQCLSLAQVHSPVLAACCCSGSPDISRVSSLTSAVFLLRFPLGSIFMLIQEQDTDLV